jgi:hypothetical protein
MQLLALILVSRVIMGAFAGFERLMAGFTGDKRK